MRPEQAELELARDFDTERARRTIAELRARGLDDFDVAGALNDREMPAPDGGRWSGHLVRMFTREMEDRS